MADPQGQPVGFFPPLVPTPDPHDPPVPLDAPATAPTPASVPPAPPTGAIAPRGFFPPDPTDRLAAGVQGGATTGADTAAKIFALQLQTGLPHDVIARNLDDVAKQAAVQGFDAAKFRRETPLLAQWIEQHPLNGAVAQDDLPTLGAIERTLTFAGAAGRRFAADLYRATNLGTWSILEAAGDVLKLPGLTDWAKRQNAYLNYATETIAGPTAYDPTKAPGPVAAAILSGIGAAGGMAPAMGFGLLGGGERAVLGVLGVQTGAEQYSTARAAGLDVGPSLAYGTLQGATMTAAAKIPTGFLLGDLAAGAGLPKTLAHQLVTTIPIMQVQTAMQDFNEWAYLHPDRPFSDYLDARPQAAMQSLISTIAMVATQTGGAHTLNKVVGGLAAGRTVEDLAKDATSSKLAQRAPAKFDEFVQHAADHGGTTFYAPVDTFSHYWQERGIDPEVKAAQLTGDPQALAKARVANTDLEIPAGKLATELAGDPATHTFYAAELRLHPDEWNAREAEAFIEQHKADAATADGKPPEVMTPSRLDEIHARLVEQLKAAGYPDAAANTNSELLKRLVGVPATRAGLDPLQVYEQYGVRISREALTPAPEARNLLTNDQAPGTAGTDHPAPAGADARGGAGEPASADAGGPGVRRSEQNGLDLRGAVEVPETYRSHFDAVLADARARGFEGSDDSLAATYLAHVEEAKGIARDSAVATEEDDRSWRGLLTAVAAAGGVGVDANTGKTADVGGRAMQGGSRGEAAALLDAFDRQLVGNRAPKPGQTKKARKMHMRLTGDVAGIRGIVKRTGGQTFDTILEALHEGGRFQHLDSITGLIDALHTAIAAAHTPGGVPSLSVEGIMSSLLDVREGGDWWREKPVNLLDDVTLDGAPLDQGYPPTSFDPTTFLWQDLFTAIGPDPAVPVDELAQRDDEHQAFARRSMERALEHVLKASERPLAPDRAAIKAANDARAAEKRAVEPPTPPAGEKSGEGTPQPGDVDVLDTGERQPRLPGDVGAVREQEHAQPPVAELRDEFRLTAPAETQAKQTSLFQSAYHGTPHKFEEFSLHAIGTGEGNAAYGWGLYFASKRDIADRYREGLAGPAVPKTLAIAGEGNVFAQKGLYTRLLETRNDESTTPENRAHAGRMVQGLNELHSRYQWAPATPEGLATIRRDLEISIKNVSAAQAEGRSFSGEGWRDTRDLDNYQAALDVLKEFGDRLTIAPPERPGRTFTVELPDDAHYLDWDKPASQQSEPVQAALRALGVEWTPFKPMSLKQWDRWVEGPTFARLWREDIGIREALAEGQRLAQASTAGFAATAEETAAFDRWQAQHQGLFNKGVVDPTGEQLYDGLARRHQEEVRINSAVGTYGGLRDSAKRASEALAGQGLAGIRYLDGFSRQAGEGSSNFVVFDPKLITVKEYDQAAPPALTQPALDAWVRQIKQEAGGDLLHLDLHLHPNGDLSLDTIAVARGAQRAGLGTAILERLTQLADRQGVRITLTLAEPGYLAEETKGTTSRRRLVEFYKRFGFVENTGRRRDYSLTASMYRDPSLGQPFFHGTGKDFNRFSTEHVGTGEGAAAYGWGLYFAENPSVATGYHERLAGESPLERLKLGSMAIGPFNGFDYTRRAHVNTVENVRASLAEDLLLDEGRLRASANDAQKIALERLDEKIADYKQQPYPEGVAAAEQLRAELARPGAVVAEFGKTEGGVYQVNIPDAHVEKMLDWDAPIGKQPAGVQQLVRDRLKELKYLGPKDDGPRQLARAFEAYLVERGGMSAPKTGESAYELLVDAQKEKTAGVLLEEKKALMYRHGSIPVAERDAKTNDTFTREFNRLTDAIEAATKDAAKNASLALAAKGVPGLKYFDAGSRDDQRGTRNVVVFDESIVTITHKDGTPVSDAERKEFLQEMNTKAAGAAKPAGRRGVLRFGPDRQMNIALFEQADLSTFIHESGHLGLEVFNDVVDHVRTIPDDARTITQQQLVADQATIFEWLGVKDRAELAATDAAHERFTEGLSQYLLEGKAPSTALRQVFDRIRSWLLAFYRSLKPHLAELNPEVRDVFDRMLATDHEILQAQQDGQVAPKFLTAEAAGMSPARFALYESAVADASRVAREELDAKLQAERAREVQREWKERKAELHDQVEQDVYNRPVYQALAAMQRGTKPDGSPLIDGAAGPTPAKLSRDLLVERYGKDRLKRLPKPYLYAAEGGMDPDHVADLFGYSSGDELLTAVEQAAPMRQVIAHETNVRMLAEHGSLLLDGTLHETARAAVANDYRERVLREELRAFANLKRTAAPFVKEGELAVAAARAEQAYERRWLEAEAKLRIAIAEGYKQVEIDALTEEVQNLRKQARGGAATIRAALPPDAVLRQIARDRVNALPITALKPETYWAAARRASRLATESAARQDFNTAIAATQQELLNTKLYRAVADAKADVAVRVRRALDLSKPAAQRRIGLAGHGILEQLNALLSRYGLRADDGRPVPSLSAWIASLDAEGVPGLDQLPPELLGEPRRPYTSLTYQELVGASDGITQLAHLATLVNTVLTKQKHEDFVALRDDLAAGIRAKSPTRTLPLEFRPAQEAWRRVESAYASHAKLSTLLLSYDGGVDGGPMWEAIHRPANAAADAQAARNIQTATDYHDLVAKYYTQKERDRFGDKLFIPAIGASLSKEARLEILKNFGNETSRDRVLRDPRRKWSAAQVQAIIDTLDRRDGEYVQAHWDFLQTFWPEIAEKSKRLTGLEPVKVEPLPVMTPYGELRGGYHPLVYDSRLDVRVGQAEAVSEAKLVVAGAYLASTTARGHEKTRLDSLDRPIRYEMATTFGHLEQVIHDLTHHEMLIDVTRLLRDRKLAQAMVDTYGDIRYRKITKLVQDIAQGDRAPGGQPSLMEKSATWVRQRSQMAGLAYNVWTMLQQPLGVFNGAQRVGIGWVAKGSARWLRDAASMENTAHWIGDKSPLMKERLGGRGLTQDFHDLRTSLGRGGGWFDRLVKTVSNNHVTQQGLLDSYMYGIGLAQSVADIPTWLGAYEKEMARRADDEPRAIALADQAVLDSQGGSHIKDLADVQRGGALARLFMTFASYSVTVLNAGARAAIQTDFRSPASMLRFAWSLSLLYAVPQLVTETLRCGVGRADCSKPKDFLERTAAGMITTALNGVAFPVRDVASAVNIGLGLEPSTHGYEGPAGVRALTSVYDAAVQLNQGKWDDAAEKATLRLTGMLFNFPADQLQRSIDGFVALQEGRSHNPLAVLVGAPPKSHAK